MRMRKKKHADERILACDELMLHTNDTGDAFNESDFIDGRLRLEIGCGKGGFICETAKREGDVHFIAVEKISNVAVSALERAKTAELENLRFVIGDAARICELLPENCVDILYLNFSDPWPKKGYAKRRLTHRSFLEMYRRVLKPDGAIFFKTDNRGLFDFSLEEFTAAGYELKNVTYDLHNSEFAENNVMTEYERNFSEKGVPINRCEARLKA